MNTPFNIIGTKNFFVQYIAAFISTVTKYYSSYVAVPFLRKITNIQDFLLQSKAILQKLFYVIIFHNHLHHK
jgi:hypothetical protein